MTTEISKLHRAAKRRQAPEKLRQHGLTFRTNNAGVHLIVTDGTAIADFWPGTERWQIRGGAGGVGLNDFLRKFGRGAGKGTQPTTTGAADVYCDYCGRGAQLISGKTMFPHRADLANDQFWRCQPCHAHVGCQAGTAHPLGRLANAELRKAKQAAHAAFDPMWQAEVDQGVSKKEARGAAYAWLAFQLGVDPKECHIGMFDIERCHRVIDAVRNKAATERNLAMRYEGGDG